MVQSNILLVCCQDAISVLERVEKFKSFIKTFGTVICFSLLMFCAYELESFRVAFQSCVLETTSCSAKVREGQFPQRLWCASGCRCILTHNLVAIPMAIPINPSVGLKGKVCDMWGKPNWRKGRKQEVVWIFLTLQIVQWLSNGHLTLHEHKP